MESLESALALLMERVHPVERTEYAPLQALLDRVAAEDVAAPIQVPPFDRSPLDGYALRGADIAGASRDNPVRLQVIGEACAGCGEIFAPGPGQALRVMTGAPVPAACDCVVRQEDTDQGMDTVEIYAAVPAGRNVCRAGEDVHLGDVVLHRGERITAAHMGVLASLGVTGVKVYAPVRVALLCTGDELRQPGEELPFGKIYDANRAVLSARLAELGVSFISPTSQEDDPEVVAQALRQVVEHCDILLTTGGVSVGKKDIFHQVLPLLGAERLFWKVAMKPGSPLLCGVYQGKLLICLSGNPFAALACFEVFAVPVLRRLAGEEHVELRRAQGVLEGDFPKESKGRRLIRARMEGERVTLTGDNHSSGSLATMIGCNCLIDIPAGTGPLHGGDRVEVILL